MMMTTTINSFSSATAANTTTLHGETELALYNSVTILKLVLHYFDML